MKIGLNASCFNERPSGAKQRFVGLYSEVINKAPQFHFVIFNPSDYRLNHLFPFKNVSFIDSPIPSQGRLKKFIKSFGYWKKTLIEQDFDIFENFNLPIVSHRTGKTFQTIHDVRYLTQDFNYLSKWISWIFHYFAIKQANQILTVSETMKEEILELFPSANVSAIYNGVSLPLNTKIDSKFCESVLEKYKLPTNFLLAVGHLEERKNYRRLVSAINKIYLRGKKDIFLLIIGKNNGSLKSIKQSIANCGLEKNIRILSDLSDEELKAIYSLSKFFIFSSLYEGFGIPILEAMLYEKPMALSNIPVFREITQNKYLYFNPYSSKSIADSIEQLIKIENYDEMISYGNNRLIDFDYTNLAESILNLYNTNKR